MGKMTLQIITLETRPAIFISVSWLLNRLAKTDGETTLYNNSLEHIAFLICRLRFSGPNESIHI